MPLASLFHARRRRDSNPRAPEGKRISSAPRYDHFDTSAYVVRCLRSRRSPHYTASPISAKQNYYGRASLLHRESPYVKPRGPIAAGDPNARASFASVLGDYIGISPLRQHPLSLCDLKFHHFLDPVHDPNDLIAVTRRSKLQIAADVGAIFLFFPLDRVHFCIVALQFFL